MVVRTPDVDATRRLGEALAEHVFPGAVICLRGELGAGKTAFAQGIARGLGVLGPVPSPTFVLIAEYPDARIPLRHADLYRLEDRAAIEALGLEERVGEEGVWVIEWAEKYSEWPEDRLDVHLAPDPGGRMVSFSACGPRHARILRALGGR